MSIYKSVCVSCSGVEGLRAGCSQVEWEQTSCHKSSCLPHSGHASAPAYLSISSTEPLASAWGPQGPQQTHRRKVREEVKPVLAVIFLSGFWDNYIVTFSILFYHQIFTSVIMSRIENNVYIYTVSVAKNRITSPWCIQLYYFYSLLYGQGVILFPSQNK